MKFGKYRFRISTANARLAPILNVIRTCLAILEIDQRYHKIFAIGFNKTGTTSIHVLLSSLRYRSYHNPDWVTSIRSYRLFSTQAFSDGEFANFRSLDKYYPRSKFILNIRDLDEWLDSRLVHVSYMNTTFGDRAPSWSRANNINPNIEGWILERNEYHLEVMEYFKNRANDLLIVNYVRDPLAAEKIADFLGKKKIGKKPHWHPIPKSRESGKLHFAEDISNAFRRLGIPKTEWNSDIYCDSLLLEPSRHLFPSDTTQIL